VLKERETGDEQRVGVEIGRHVARRKGGVCAAVGDDGVPERDSDAGRQLRIARKLRSDATRLERGDDEVARRIVTDAAKDASIRLLIGRGSKCCVRRRTARSQRRATVNASSWPGHAVT